MVRTTVETAASLITPAHLRAATHRFAATFTGDKSREDEIGAGVLLGKAKLSTFELSLNIVEQIFRYNGRYSFGVAYLVKLLDKNAILLALAAYTVIYVRAVILVVA